VVRQRFADLFFDQLGRGANLTLLCGVTSCVAAETPESTVHARKTAMNVSAKLRFVMSASPVARSCVQSSCSDQKASISERDNCFSSANSPTS
jgi:hypothetical protein